MTTGLGGMDVAMATATAMAVALVAVMRKRMVERYPTTVQVEELVYYPVKALAPVRPNRVRVVRRGIQHDRRFMVTDNEGNFITQRQYPRLALVQVRVEGEDWESPELEPAVTDRHTLVITAPGMPELRVSHWMRGEPLASVRVWDSHVPGARDQGREAGLWFSKFLDLPFECRLVYMASGEASRPTKRAPEHEVSFADGYPLLITSTSSLRDLNARIPSREVIPMERFMPNLVVSGLAPWMEDTVGLTLEWTDSAGRTGRVFMNKPCDRCKVTTIVPSLGEFSPTDEPMRTLATFRRIKYDAGVYFGGNLLVLSEAVLSVGDTLRVTWPWQVEN